MKNENSSSEYKIELKDMLTKLEVVLSESGKTISNADLTSLCSQISELDETATLYGINSINNLISPINKGLAQKQKKSEGLNKTELGVLLSSISMSIAVIEDPSLNDPSLKISCEKLKEQVLSVYSLDEDEVDEDDSFLNNRFQEIFFEEAYDLINQLEEKLLQMESQPDDPDLIDTIFRIMHTLKGNSNMFGHAHLGEITHHLENIYDEIRSHKIEINRQILNITLQCVDHFRNLIEDIELKDATNKSIQDSILNEITDILKPSNQVLETKSEGTRVENSMKTYYLFFEPLSNIFDDGTNPLYFVYDLLDIGQCLAIPTIEKIPDTDEYHPEMCYTSWHIVISTKNAPDLISDNFIFLRDESQPSVNHISDIDLLASPEFIEKFKSAAVSTESIESQLTETNGDAGVQKDAPRVIKTKTTATESGMASIRVASTKIDLMMNYISELVTKQAELSMLAVENKIPQLQEVAESIESISRDLRDNAFSISLIPIEKSALRFQRLVRDVSTKFNKQVDFIVEGKETELDKTIIEKIVDPIMHILRNSIDHGIELPEVRKRKGKPEHGTIRLRAFPSGAHVIIEISDDGAGINVDMVKKVAVRKGYITENDEFTTEDMLKLILQPGFSTTENVSEVSGRGVGMDVVNQKIMEIRGELDVKTEANMGTTMTIKLPLTISIIDSLLVKIGDTFYLIALSVVERCAEVLTPVITESSTNYLNMDNEFIPFIDLRKEFEVEGDRGSHQRLIMVKHADMKVAIVVDEILGNHQAVLKTLGQIYRRQEIISGASILGNGDVSLVLDTNKLVQEYMSSKKEEINKINLLNSTLLDGNK